MNRNRQQETKPPTSGENQRTSTYLLAAETGPENYQEILKRELARKRTRETTLLPKFDLNICA